MRTRRRGIAALAALAASCLAASCLAACGVPSDGDVRTLGTPPFGLLTTSTTTPPSTVPPDEGFRLTLYWVAPDDEIVPGEPTGLPGRPTFQAVLDLLTEGPPMEPPDGSSTTSRGSPPTTADQALRSYVTEGLNPDGDDGEPGGTGPQYLEFQEGTVDLLVADRFRDESQATPTRFRLAIAQLVCTLTQFENVHSVRLFDSRGQLTLVNLEQNPIEVGTRANIGQCEPSRQATTTTTTTADRPPASPTTTAAGRVDSGSTRGAGPTTR